jgi:hypothetical protein
MPVIHDVDTFSGEWHHKSMGCLPSSFVACATAWGVKLTNGAARWRCSERPSSVRSLCERSSRGLPQERQPSFLLMTYDDMCCLNPTHCACAQRATSTAPNHMSKAKFPINARHYIGDVGLQGPRGDGGWWLVAGGWCWCHIGAGA